MTEIWFYHLEQRRLEDVLPTLLERSLQRGWRAVVQAGSAERVAMLDEHLWTYKDESFLPHGPAGEGDAATQPVFLTDGPGAPNDPAIRFMMDGAQVEPVLAGGPPYERVVLLFDGRDDDAVADARRQWAALKRAGHAVSYWQQDEDGRWDKRA